MRRPRITNTAPEINAIALPAEAGLTSGATVAKVMLAIPINNKTLPNTFIVSLLLLYFFFDSGQYSSKPFTPELLTHR